MRLALLALFAATMLSTAAKAEGNAEKPKQLVLLSFDGAGSNELWQRSRDFARDHNARFTYFVSCTLVIPRAEAKRYEGPGKRPGRSNIGFAQDRDEARQRLGHIWNAHVEGHEISSHTCGHFDGKDWSAADWSAEFDNFDRVMREAWTALDAGGSEPEGWRDFVENDIRGFRAPYFSTSAGMVAAERKAGFSYDASLVTKGPMMPQQEDGLVRFGLPLIPEGPSQRPIIAMDYNLFVRHSAGVDNPSRSAAFEERAYSAFRAAFEKQYEGDRIPLQIGLHFVEMNGGAYWRAMERLASEVCGTPDVACVTYSQAIDMLRQREQGDTSGL
jgi:peptidoglycan/xylan/chitin deacetylase (PgdA/CDA1 family)